MPRLIATALGLGIRTDSPLSDRIQPTYQLRRHTLFETVRMANTKEFEPSHKATKRSLSGTRVATYQDITCKLTGQYDDKESEGIMIWAIIIAGTYVAGIYVIRLVWWQE